MDQPEPEVSSEDELPKESRRGPWVRAFRRPIALIALLFLCLLVFVAVFAPLIATHDPAETDLKAVFKGPSWSHLLGTDTLGRDLFSRLVYGTRTSLSAASEAVALSLVLGLPIGLFAGYLGGRLDQIAGRFIDALLSVPSLILAVAMIAALGPGLSHAMIAIGIAFTPRIFRVVRASAHEVRHETFIEASESIGCSKVRTALVHILPNVMSPVLIAASLMFGVAVLAEGGLSFLGLGAQPPTPSWGTMLFDARQRLDLDYLIWAPGALIFATVVAFTMVGEALRDAISGSRGRSRG